MGEELFICRRVSCSPSTIGSIDGKTYNFIKELRDGSHMYVDSRYHLATGAEKKLHYSLYGNSQSYGTVSHLERQHYAVSPLPNDKLNLIYLMFLKLLPLQKKHYQKLRKDGWPHELIMRCNIGSLLLDATYDDSISKYSTKESRRKITSYLLQRFDSLVGVPGFYRDTDNAWTFYGKSGLLIPSYDINGNIYRLRLRLDHPETGNDGKPRNKYKNFSSYYETKDEHGILMNAFTDGCRAGSPLGLYYNPKTDDPLICYITEGEKKSILANWILHCPVISIPGVNSFSKLLDKSYNGLNMIDFLKQLNCSHIVIAYDADKYINDCVLKCENQLIELLTKNGFNISIAYWNPGFGKGLDDILAIGVRPTLIPV